MDYLIHIVYIVCVYGILCISLDIIIGHLGDLSLAHAAFCGLGAYASALVSQYGGVFVGVAVGMMLSVFYSLALSAFSLRLKGDYFILATLGFAVIFTGVVTNSVGLTGGAGGIAGVPFPAILGFRIDSGYRFFFLGISALALSILVYRNISLSPFGRVLRALRDDEVFVESLGRNPFVFRAKAYCLSAAMASLAGSLYAHYVRYVDPYSFSMDLSILLVAMVILGGAGTRWGALSGAVALVVLPEALRFVGISGPLAGNIRQIIVGLGLVTIVFYRPLGLSGVSRHA